MKKRTGIWFRLLAALLALPLMLTSCYYNSQESTLYEVGDNFVLSVDSLELQMNQPLHNLPIDTLSERITMYDDCQLVVAETMIIPEDSIDSVWVKLASDQMTMGWVHQQDFVTSVVPDRPISCFIHAFSVIHLGAFGFIILVACIAVFCQRKQEHIFYFRDIMSIYPTLLVITLSASVILYASIQYYVPETWELYYYHPTLNPFELPMILSLFLTSVWLLIILSLSTASEVLHQLPFGEAMLYLLSLLGCCIICYLLFMPTAFCPWLGYILFSTFAGLLLWRHFRYFYPRYMCGNCGAKMHDKGKCPRCGTLNG